LAIFNRTRIPCSKKNSNTRPMALYRKVRCTAGRTPHLNRSKNSSRLGFAAACFYMRPAENLG